MAMGDGQKMTPVGHAFAMAKDPTCGMEVDTAKATAAGLRLEYQGTTYYFCSEDCKIQFRKEPKRYTGGTGAPANPTHAHQPGGNQL